MFEEWRKRYPLWSHNRFLGDIYHICAKHTILFRVFGNSCALYYWRKLCWSDPEGQKPLEDSSINSFQSYLDSLTYCIPSSSEASLWMQFVVLFFKRIAWIFKMQFGVLCYWSCIIYVKILFNHKNLQSVWRGNGVNFFFVFGIINSGVIATVNSQGKCFGFYASCL